MLPAPSFFSLPVGGSTGTAALIRLSADRLAATLPAMHASAAPPPMSGVALSQPTPDSRAALRSRCARARKLALSAQGNGAQAADPLEAVIIVDHGSRRDESNAMLYEFADIYRCDRSPCSGM